MKDILISLFLIIGCFFILASAVGILRFPDLLTRMHASTKAGTLGLGFILLAGAIFFADIFISFKAIGIALFVILTSPVGGHLLAKASLISGYQMWKNPATKDSWTDLKPLPKR